MAPKRAAPKATKAAPPRKAAKKEEPMLAAVVEALEGSAELPDACKQMLVAGGRHSLSLYAEDRHEHQATVVRLIEEALHASQRTVRAKLAAEEALAAGADAEQTRLEAVIAAAKADADSAADKVAGEENALAAKTDTMMAARRALAEVKKANKEAGAARSDLISEEQELGKILQEHFAPVEAGEIEASDAAAHAEALLKVAESLGLDESLRLALPKTCSKKKEERGPFDAMVMEQLASSLRSQHKQLTDMVAAEGPAAEARARAEEEKGAALTAAEAAQKAAATLLATANAAMDEIRAALQKAKETAKAFEEEFAATTAGRDAAKAELENFTNYTLECFDMLKTKAKPKPVEKPVEKPAEVPVEAAHEEPAAEDL